jgi:predicted peptidase
MKLHRSKVGLLVACLLVCLSTTLAQANLAFEKKKFVQGSDTLLYRILYPAHQQPGKTYPMVLVLHGSGEKGNDNQAQLVWGASLFVDSLNRAKYPAIVLFPQCPANDFWVNGSVAADSLGFSFPANAPPTQAMRLVMELVKQLARSGQVNNRKIYVGGLSEGGFGTYDILWRMPHFFAAAFPICGGGNPQQVKYYAAKFPIWVFHGAIDPTVPVANAHLMVRVLKQDGANVKYSEYPGVGHDSWKNAFAEPGLLPWLFSQTASID